MEPITGIIVLEGADAAGKTTLAHEFIKKNGDANCCYLHAGIADDFWELHMNLVKLAIEECDKKLVIIDRLWLSEMVYGPIYRGKTAYNYAARSLDRLLLKHATLNILCVPKNAKKHIDEFNKLKKKRHEEFRDVTDVVLWYHNLAYGGNLIYAPDNYGSQFIQNGDYPKRRDVMIYDRFTYGNFGSIEQFMTNALGVLEILQKTQYPKLLQAGYPYATGHLDMAKIVFVGEKLSPKAEYPWPWFWPEKWGSAHFLSVALHKCGFNEADGFYINVLDHLSESVEILMEAKRQGKMFIALGKKAGDVCDDLELPTVHIPHPSYWRRFKSKDPEGYVKLLGNAINYIKEKPRRLFA